jgi:hypothetical protein
MYIRQHLLEDEQSGDAPEYKPPVIEKVAESMKATAAYNCWVDRQGRFDASQTYVMPDLIMGVDDAIADLRRGKLVIVGINHIEKVRRSIEIEGRDE